MAGRFLNLFKVFSWKRNTDAGAAPAQHPEEPEQFQPLQDDAAMDRRQEQEPTRGRFSRTLKRFRKFLPIRHRKISPIGTEGTAEPDSGLTELQAEPDVSPDSAEPSENSDAAVSDNRAEADVALTEDMAIPNTGETQGITNTDTMPPPTVPATVRNIHQSLMCYVTVDATLPTNIVKLAEQHPMDVVLTLLRCAPSCDRAAAVMWKTIASSGPVLEKVLPTLLRVMENWPLCSICTSDGDNKDVFALAATLVLWVIMQVPQSHEVIMHVCPSLFTALLLHVFTTTQLMPAEVDNFWRECQEQHHLPRKPNRFAVQAMKALLCCLQYDSELMAMERKCGWETLLRADTQHYAVGLLARVMRRGLMPLCCHVAYQFLRRLIREEARWDLSTLAFLVEVLDCLDLRECGDSVLEIASRHLQSECRQRRRLALRGLVVLSKEPSMARPIHSLCRSFLQLLSDTDEEVVSMSLSVFTNMLQKKNLLLSRTAAPKIAEPLLMLFDHDKSHVQVLSIHLFCKVMDLVVDEGKKPLERLVNQSLLPLILHCHDENWRVANASWETLHCAATFLNNTDLQRVLKTENLSKITECVLAQDESRAAEYLHRALPYLDSPQEPLREAAVRFIGTVRKFMHKGAQGRAADPQ
ncbi:maestro heat-like repeat-containing protein family member 7 [Cyanistes caeruleus]|uniref:maestro heat-like repeat-containing protein family member 7 n=1 Tax=Cyanistes caeruleus TaxID=156563 RepID=UPI000CDA051E|nr:maestro heat-like repeat-containing protein family member 7 [Cyanistes caeruleus]